MATPVKFGVGQSVLRKEDDALIRGKGRYTDDFSPSHALHALVLREVEVPLLREVLAFHDGNQSRAASALGINRATLRKKLALHGLL